ncbi:MAG TPA: threonylcarbamoyl-AMP synthase [Elusimicrobia bacterium]|nr:MAG: threonylcarbamoyl-AMP synthase [Elusimicrobia bacterium RIFOXYA12_FULL_49_49]OGS14964.1 MAG: threonylcarbamoyl-AMP synthase [Elusimicrobia bacterium RIFOXYA2_FULL_47_53]OGS26101.1 MAG: threonylcarbamoyl-AMP synthase [Elusimicrobia bacterium RIFOXYB12_FULL_50_12]OGS29309.1 MAG: threonylcarbamoyl-AMP synthase [Elusimicrobia bacterium RIFOXYB2_FULL_46_23]HBU70339.1 threonylcarbamoyl-AMP synthase [Elusimicrobiota bacterium]
MRTSLIKIPRSRPSAAKLKEAVSALEKGGVVIFPTDTVYGMAANAFNAAARKKIYALKGRHFTKPLILMVPNIAAASLVAEVPHKAIKIAKKFWPGPLTLIFPTSTHGKMVMGGRKDVGVRIPDDSVAGMLLKLCPFPLATTSANPSGKESAVDAKTAEKYFGGKLDLIIDSGACRHARESTVIDMVHFPYVVIREGCLPSKKLLKYI